MAGDSHEEPGGEAEEEGKAVERHSRHASIGEESPSSSSSSLASSDGPPPRRFSLPAAIPAAAPDSVASPLSQRSHRRLDTVVPVGMLAPQYHSGYRACPHRAHVLGGGPPCYLCSVLDVPPKYRRKEAKGWQKVKEKLTLFSHSTPIPSQSGRPRGEQELPAAVFTINEWRPSGTLGAAPAQDGPAALHDQRQAHERDNLAFDAQDQQQLQNGAECRAAHLPPDATAFGHSFASLPNPPDALITNTRLPPILLPRDDTTDNDRNTKCNRRMVCQLLYSFLLATASSTLIVSYDQPVLVIISVIVFLALFVFLPVIAVLECLFRCKMERDFREYINGIITSPPAPTTPAVY